MDGIRSFKINTKYCKFVSIKLQIIVNKNIFVHLFAPAICQNKMKFIVAFNVRKCVQLFKNDS